MEGLNRYASPQMKWNEKLYRILNRKFKQSAKLALCLWAELLQGVTFFVESILIFVTKLHILNVYHISRIIRRVMSDGNKE